MSLFLENRPYIAAIMAGRPPIHAAPDFGKRLATLRKARNLSQAQFAQLVGKPRHTVDYYERRAKNPTAEFLEKAAQVLGVTVNELLGGESAPASRKPGPPSRLQQLTQRLSTLPRQKQKVVVDMLEGFLQKTDS